MRLAFAGSPPLAEVEKAVEDLKRAMTERFPEIHMVLIEPEIAIS